MIDNISASGSAPLYPIRPLASVTPATPAVAPATPAVAHEDTTIPETPPAEVLHALDAAQGAISDLASRDLELRFEVDDGHIRAQLLDADGDVVQEIPARHGLDMLAGKHLVDHKA